MFKGFVFEIVDNSNVYLRGHSATYQSAWEMGVDYLDDPSEWRPYGVENVFPQLRIGRVAEFALCAGRHEMPVDEAIFEKIEDPTNYRLMEEQANFKIDKGVFELHIYVTGLTAAMLAVTKVCVKRNIRLIAHHFDPTTGKYREQVVVD